MAELSEELLNKLNIEGSLTAKEFAEMLLFDTQNDIDDLRRSFKKNFLDKFKNQLDNIKTQDIKRIFDPLGLSGLLRDPDSLRDEYKEYKNKLRKQLRKATESLNKKDDDDVNTKSTTSTPEQPKQAPPTLNENNTEVSPEIKNDKQQTGEKNKNQNNIQEQRGLGKETSIIEFSENTNKFLSDLFGKYFELKEKTEKQKQSEKQPEDKEKEGSNSLLDLLGYIVAGGVLAAFWGDYIRPFLEEKFDFMDRLKGTFNALEKGIYTFFGKGLDIGVTVVKSVSEFATGLVKSVFNFLTGGGATGKAAGAVIAEGGEAAGKKVMPSLLARLGAKLLPVLKFVPLIGGFISLKFGYDRIMAGDFTGGLIDFVGAIGSFITPFSGPIGAAISWGALALNAYLDITKTDEDTKKENQNADWLKKLPKTIGKALLNNPIIKSISNMGSGLWDYVTGLMSGDTGKAVKGLKTLNDSPLSFMSSFLLPLFEENVKVETKTGQSKLDMGKFWQESTKTFMKKYLPNWLYNLVAKTMGWNETPTQEFDIQKNESQFFDTSKPKSERYPAITKLNEETTKTRKEIENLDKEMTDFTFSKEVSLEKEKQLNDLKEKLRLLEESDARIKGTESGDDRSEWPTSQKTKPSNPVTEVQDGEIDYTPKLKVGNNTIAKFAPDDQFKIMAAKPDGVFEQMNKNLISNFEIMAKQFGELSKTLLSQQKTSNNSVVNISNAGANQNKFTMNVSDPILRSRTSYIQSPLRII